MVHDNDSDKSGDNDNDDKLIMTMTPGSAIAGFNFISNWLSGRPTVKEEQEMETISIDVCGCIKRFLVLTIFYLHQ